MVSKVFRVLAEAYVSMTKLANKNAGKAKAKGIKTVKKAPKAKLKASTKPMAAKAGKVNKTKAPVVNKGKPVVQAAKIVAKTAKTPPMEIPKIAKKGKAPKAASAPKTAPAKVMLDGKVVNGGKKAEALAQIIGSPKEEEVILTNADGKEDCRVHDCDNE